MTYFVVILLSIINIIFEVYPNKKGNVLSKYYLHKYFYNVVSLNIFVFFVLAASLFLNNYLGLETNILTLIINGIYALTFVLLVLQHEKYKINNKVLETNNYLNILIMILVISMLIGDREDLVDASALLILPTLMSLILLFITIIKSRVNIELFKKKEQDDGKWKYNKKININNIFYLAIITTIVLLLIIDKSITSYVAFSIIAVITIIFIKKKQSKIKTEQNKLSNGIKNDTKIGKEYIFDFQRDIIITRTIIKYLVIAAVALLTNILLQSSYIIISTQILVIVLYIGLLNKIKLNKIYDSLNKKAISKEYKKVENTLLNDISINDRVLNIKYDKVIYIKDKDIYKSEELLFNIKKEDLNKIDLYINTLNYNDYIFVVEEIYK